MPEPGRENGQRLQSDQFTRPAAEHLSRSALRALAARSLPPSRVDAATAAGQVLSGATETTQESTRLRRRSSGPSHRRYVQPLVLENSRVRVQSRYEGVVTEVDQEEGYFQARLATPGLKPELIAEFRLEAVMDDDLDLLAPGAPFYVLTGRLTSGGGRTSAVTSLRFKRLGKLRQEDVDFHMERGAKYRALLGLDE